MKNLRANRAKCRPVRTFRFLHPPPSEGFDYAVAMTPVTNPFNPMEIAAMNFREHIRSIVDYPKPGIVFRDITTFLEKPEVLRAAADTLAEAYGGMGIDKVAVVESRGFLLGGILAYKIGAGLVLIRKKGKLPYLKHTVDYSLEYGLDSIEIHQGAVKPGERILLHDDLLATGGTMAAAAELVKRSGGVIVGASFLIELGFLPGRQRLLEAGVPDVQTLVNYEDESL
jgi:adenine phosphoribosyltransferase